MYIHRTIEDILKKTNQGFPALLITGPRQVGKTSCLKQIMEPNRKYVTLDDYTLRKLAQEEPRLFLQQFTPPVLIDEIQYAPQLLSYIKMLIDDNKQPGMFWLTGSQQFHLMKAVSESLAGRVGIINLLGFSYRELSGDLTNVPFLPTLEIINARLQSVKQKLNINTLYEIIWRGSFPALTAEHNLDRNMFYNSYIQTYIQRDIRDLSQVGDETTFFNFMCLTAARTGQLLNIADLARDVGISPNTAKAWLSILKASSIIYLLEPYHSNLSKRLIKAPKLYFLDTGLAAYLMKWPSSQVLEANPSISGALLETWLFSEILKSYWHNGDSLPPLYYYRDKDKKEIDLLIIIGNQAWPIEFKKTAAPQKSMIANFSLIRNLNLDVQKGALICLYPTFMPLSDDAYIVPIDAI